MHSVNKSFVVPCTEKNLTVITVEAKTVFTSDVAKGKHILSGP